MWNWNRHVITAFSAMDYNRVWQQIIHTHTYINIRTHRHICIYTHICMHIRMQIHTSIGTNESTSMLAYINIYVTYKIIRWFFSLLSCIQNNSKVLSKSNIQYTLYMIIINGWYTLFQTNLCRRVYFYISDLKIVHTHMEREGHTIRTTKRV